VLIFQVWVNSPFYICTTFFLIFHLSLDLVLGLCLCNWRYHCSEHWGTFFLLHDGFSYYRPGESIRILGLAVLKFFLLACGGCPFKGLFPMSVLREHEEGSFILLHQFSCSVVSKSATLWTAARQASLSITNSRSLLKLMSIALVMPSNHLILCRPLFLPPSIFPSIRVYSNESVFAWGGQSIGVSASVLPVNIQDWFPLGLTGWISLHSKGLSRTFSNTTVQKLQFFSTQLSL